jgi:hypothetical protein
MKRVVFNLVALLALTACGPDPMPADGGTTAPTFTNVHTVLVRSCALRSCHGGTSISGGLSLGTTAAEAYASLVGVNATQVPRLKRVLAANAAESWLMIKLDNAMSGVSECRMAGAMCGVSMPERAMMLPVSERDVFRRWINAGAPGP